MEAGESERQTALREVREETGLTGIKLMDGFRESVEYSPKPGVKQVVYFLGTTEQEKLIRQEEEIGEIVWAPLSRAAELVSLPMTSGCCAMPSVVWGCYLPNRKKSRIWRRRQNKNVAEKTNAPGPGGNNLLYSGGSDRGDRLAHHPETSWPLAVTLALLIAANVLQILRDHKDRKDEK